MLFLLDASVLVTANRLDFPISAQHVFWQWLVQSGEEGAIKIPEAVFNEVHRGNDALAHWLRENKAAFFIPTTEALPAINDVLRAYEDPIREKTLDAVENDAYVIAHALVAGGTVVTEERPRPATAGHNKKIPTICTTLSILCMRLAGLLWELRR